MFHRRNESILRYVTTATALSLGLGLVAVPVAAQQAGQQGQSATVGQQQDRLEQTEPSAKSDQGMKPEQRSGEPFYNEAEGAQGNNILRGTDKPSDYEPSANWPDKGNHQRQTQRSGDQQRQNLQQRQSPRNLPAARGMGDNNSQMRWQASEQDLQDMFSQNTFVEQDRQWDQASGARMQEISGTVVDLETLLIHGQERAVQAAGQAASLHPNDPVALLGDDGNVYVIIDRAEQQSRQSAQFSDSGPNAWPHNRTEQSYTSGSDTQQAQMNRQGSTSGQASASRSQGTNDVANIRPTDHGNRVGTQFQADMQDRGMSDRRTASADTGTKTYGQERMTEADGAVANTGRESAMRQNGQRSASSQSSDATRSSDRMASRDSNTRSYGQDRMTEADGAVAGTARGEASTSSRDASSTSSSSRTAQAGQRESDAQIRSTQHGDRIGTQYQDGGKQTARAETDVDLDASAEADTNRPSAEATAEASTRGDKEVSDLTHLTDLTPREQRRKLGTPDVAYDPDVHQRVGQNETATARSQQGDTTRQQYGMPRTHADSQSAQAGMNQDGQNGQSLAWKANGQNRQASIYRDNGNGQMQKLKDFEPSELEAGQKVTLYGSVYEYENLHGIAVEGYRVRQSQPFAQGDKPETSVDQSARASD